METIQNKDLLFYNPGMLGDVVYCIPFCLSCSGTYCKEDLNKNKFTLLIDTLIHHKNNGNAFQNLCMLRDLLSFQPYFEKIICEPHIDFEKYGALDLGKIRKNLVDMGRGDIVYRYRYLRPLKNFYRAEDPWIVLPEQIIQSEYHYFHDKIVIFRSQRYNNPNISYSYLKKFKEHLVFIGLENEYVQFRNKFDVHINFIKPKHFIEVACILNNCKFCIGNQTFYFSIAEALKVPRMLELYKNLPDVIPHGEMAMEYVDNISFEKLFDFFIKNT